MANIEIFKGVITYNTIKLYANGSKKRFEGFVVIKDSNGNDTSYKMVSFRSQVIIQSETLGERGMKGIKCVAHGEFKENTWNGETTWQFMCEKLILEGHEELADQAEKAATPLPAVPAGSLPSNPIYPIQSANVAIPLVQPNIPAPIQAVAPLAQPNIPAPIQAVAPLAQPNIPAPIQAVAPLAQPNIPAPIQAVAPLAQPNIPAPIQAVAPLAQPNIPAPIQAVAPVNMPQVKVLPDTPGPVYYDDSENFIMEKIAT